MVVIRMARAGAKKRPFYRIVVADSRCARDGRFIEKIGFFNPFAKDAEGISIDLTRVNYWVSKGARLSDSIASQVKKLSKLSKLSTSTINTTVNG